MRPRGAAKKAARRERRAEHSRLDIVRAAARCFARAGYDATTMRAIAEECGFTASSLYTYFDKKEAIFEALVEQVEESFLSVFAEPSPSDLAFPQALELLFMRLLRVFEEERDAIVFISSLAHCVPVERADHVHGADLRFIDAFASWIEARSTKAERAGHAPPDVAFFAWGAMHGFFVQWLASGARGKLDRKVSVLLEMILRGVTR